MTLVTPPSGPDFDVVDYEALVYYRREPGYVVHDGVSGPFSPAPLVPTWAAATSYTAGQVVQHPTSPDIYLRRISPGVSRGTFDATEAALWKASGSATYDAICAPPTGVDDTATIVDAITNHKRLRAGTYVYLGTGEDIDSAPWLRGHSRGYTTITVPAGKYVIDAAAGWTSLDVRDVKFSGGLGAVRNRSTAVDVQGTYVVRDCTFTGYTGAAVASFSTDMPYWKIKGNVFSGANYTSTMGVCLMGGNDASTIEDNAFLANRVNIKLGQGASNVHVERNDLIRFGATAGSPRVDVWIVPQTSSTNAGPGATIKDNKFGNENLDSADYRIVYADEDTATGTDPASYFPKFSADSTGYVIEHTIRDNLVNGTGATAPPFIYSTTPNVRGCRVDAVLSGTLPSYIIQFRTVPLAGNDPERGNIFGPFRTPDENFAQVPLSNAYNLGGGIIDPGGFLEPVGLTHALPGGGSAVGHVKLLQHSVRSFTVGGPVTLANVTDSLGGADATEATFSAGTDGALLYDYVPVGSVVAGFPIWIEVDLKQGSSSVLSSLYIQFQLDTGSLVFRRRITPPASWRRYRFITYVEATSDALITKFTPGPSATGTKVQIGRVRTYHAREPVAADLALPNTTTGTAAPSAGGAGALPATPAGYVTVFINGTLRQIAYY